MARKRMISPEIWESSSFSKLSDFAKLVFIGLISQADDEGKGKASPNIIRSKLFPDGEEKRVTDIKKALSEIALRMSITFYEVEGDSFYILTNWHSWQKIDRPTPSKIPNPPQSERTVGERGRTTQNQDFEIYSTNTRRGLDEGSSPNRIEKNIIPPLPPKGKREEKDRFFSEFPKLKPMARLNDSGVDYKLLYQRFKSSKFLQERYSAKWVLENYNDIINGVHDDEDSLETQAREREEWYRNRRERAEDIASLNRKKAEQIDGYLDDLKEMKRLEISIGKAEAEDPTNNTTDMRTALIRLKEKRKKALASIGMTEQDIEPQYNCKRCNDTGFLSNGRPCACYEKEKGR